MNLIDLRTGEIVSEVWWNVIQETAEMPVEIICLIVLVNFNGAFYVNRFRNKLSYRITLGGVI